MHYGNKEKITVIGAGNGGMAMAYSLGQMGHDVCIYDSPDFPVQINAVHEKGGIEAVSELYECPMLNAGFSKLIWQLQILRLLWNFRIFL